MQFNDPIYYAKSIKNKTEINNIKKAHINDGVALTKFLYWAKNTNIKKKNSHGVFEIGIQGRPGSDPERIVAVVQEELERIGSGDVTDGAATAAAGGARAGRETGAGAGSRAGAGAGTGAGAEGVGRRALGTPGVAARGC